MKLQEALVILNNRKGRTRDQIIEAMQCLIDSGFLWSPDLDDSYRQAALAMVETGDCHVPDWAEGSIQ
jgi:hypothetical protein